jgi:flagellar basal-body rod modification protein FlgD
MSIPATEGATPSGLLAPWAVTAGQSNGLGDQQMFLELMVTQLRYQDPLNPTDSSEFLAQTAQFTALEKMQTVADQTAMLVSSQLAFGASSLIGQSVRYLDAEGVEQTGTVLGTSFLATGPVLNIDGEEVPLFNVVSVGEGPPTDAEPPSEDVTDEDTGTTARAAD